MKLTWLFSLFTIYYHEEIKVIFLVCSKKVIVFIINEKNSYHNEISYLPPSYVILVFILIDITDDTHH